MTITSSFAKNPRIVGLPMPREEALLTDPEARVRAKRPPSPRHTLPIPNGWFAVARADELPPGDVQDLYYFGRALTLFRAETGEAHLVDAYCPHIGAHLAIGGKVEGNCIRCPFHGWKFDGDSGRCTEIPYAQTERIPDKAKVRAYRVQERANLIWAWYHAEDAEPFYDIPDVPEFDDPDWTDIDIREFEVAITCQDMAENGVDYAHFVYLHGFDERAGDDKLTIDGTYRQVIREAGTTVQQTYGLGLGVFRRVGHSIFLSSTTPIDAEHVHVRWCFSSPRSVGEEAARALADGTMLAVTQDIPIWENKIYRARPVLTKGERDMVEFRRWAAQFYSNLPEIPEDGGG